MRPIENRAGDAHHRPRLEGKRAERRPLFPPWVFLHAGHISLIERAPQAVRQGRGQHFCQPDAIWRGRGF